MSKKYKRKTSFQFYTELNNKEENSEFTTDDLQERFDQVEDACYILDINIDAEKAMARINNNCELTEVLEHAQVEFCCN